MAFYIIIGILMFGLLIFIHELGHFLMAKKCGVGIYEFSIGMGPKLFSHTGKDGVLYALRLLPIGGFVAMHGEDDDENSQNPKTSLAKKTIPQRFAVIAAGAVMNLILGFIICAGLVIFDGNSLLSTEIVTFDFSDVQGLTEYQSLKSGDEIIKMGNRNINIWHDLSYEAMFNGGKKVDLTVMRGGEKVIIEDFIVPSFKDSKTGLSFGTMSFITPKVIDKTPLQVIKQTFCQTLSYVRVVWDSLIHAVKGDFGTQALSGPVGVVGEMKDIVEMSEDGKEGFSLLFLIMIITINLGVMNLLPFPALDGGRLLFLIIEAIRKKPINPKVEAAINAGGLALLMGLMLFVTFSDITKLIG